MSRAAIVVAAGSGERLGAGVPKAFVPIGSRPMISRTIDVLEASGSFDEGVIVVPAGREAEARRLLADGRSPAPAVRWSVVPGGPRRRDSVLCGLEALTERISVVAVHDAARPFVSTALVHRVLEAAERTGAAFPALAVADSVHVVDVDGRVTASPLRASLRSAQTPQAFRRDLLVEAHRRPGDETDDVAMVAALGATVVAVAGDPGNRKITVPEDLAWAESRLRQRGPGQQ